jgi:hypothetical protein
MKTELLDFVSEHKWVLCFWGEMYTSINHFQMRVKVSDGQGREIVPLVPGWIGTIQGWSEGDYDTALSRLAQCMSNRELGIYNETPPKVLAEADKGFDTTTLVVAPELIHTKKLAKWLDSRSSECIMET